MWTDVGAKHGGVITENSNADGAGLKGARVRTNINITQESTQSLEMSLLTRSNVQNNAAHSYSCLFAPKSSTDTDLTTKLSQIRGNWSKYRSSPLESD